MKVVGNDNYREGLTPPPAKKSGGWLSSNMAQLMVFLNGLVLTATAFITLNIFIEEIVYDGMRKTAQGVHEAIDRELFNAERMISMIASTISLLPADDNHHMSEASLQTFYDSHIAHIYLMHREPETDHFTLGLNIPSDAKSPVESLAAITEVRAGNFLHYIAGDSFPPQGETKLYSELSGLQGETKLLALAYPVYYKGKVHDILVAIIHLDDLVSHQPFQKDKSVEQVFISIEANQDRPLYSFNRALNENRQQPDPQHTYHTDFTTQIADKNLKVQVNILPGERENFLIKIPLLMLMFGVTLTLIGTLYVRNNQRQSQRLSVMNRELAQKNFELSNQISESERLSQTIKRNEKQNRAVIDSVSDIIFETNASGDILFLNESWKRVTGFTIDQSIRRNIFDMLYLQDQAEQRASFDAMVNGQKKAYRSFTRLRTSNGTFRAVELAVSMIRHDDENDIRVVGTMTDVEERRRAERALAEAEKKYRAIVENAAGGIYQVTPEGIFLSANPAMARILGYETPEAMLRDVRNVTTQLYADQAARQEFLKRVAASDRALSNEAQMIRGDGLVIWVSENLRSVKDDQDMLLYYEGSLEDITKRKEAEIAMRTAKLESDIANRAKSEFLANMSHELRTPLNSIIGFSEIIKNEAFGPIGKKEYWDYANDIYESGKRLLGVINEILDVSRIQAGERQLNEGVVSVRRLMDSCIDLMRSKAEAGSIQMNNQLQNTDVQLVGEAQAIKQMILNLMSNAIKFTGDGGMVTLSGEMDSAGQFIISITDTGTGLSEEEIQKALSPFGQVDGEYNRKKSGTGLGLTLVKALVDLHGGSFDLISQKGIGTTAMLTFPAKRVSQKPAGKTSSLDKIKEDL